MSDAYDFIAARLLPAKIGEIRAFWEAFEESADELDDIFESGKGNPQRVSEIMSGLEAVSPQLMWEFGPSANGHKLSVTAEWRNELRALARAVVNMAPDLPRFVFDDARSGNDPSSLDGNFEARFRMPISVTSISTSRGDDNKIVMTGTGPGSEEGIGNEVLALGTFLLGEAIDRDWFGVVKTNRESRGFLSALGRRKRGREAFDAARFLSDFEGTLTNIRESLPEMRRSDVDLDAEERILLKMNSLPDGSGRPDLIVFNCPSQAYAKAALSTTQFSSVNHSRFDEKFLFLRIPRTPETPFDEVSERYDLEERLHAALCDAGLGGLVGAGHGTQAVYIDIGSANIDAAVPLIARTLATQPGFRDITLHFLEAGLPGIGLPLQDFAAAQN